MNVLITGIDGFVGGYLADLLLHYPDYTVYGLIWKRPPLVPVDPAVHILEADITNRAAFRAAIAASAPSKIFHLAGQAFVPLATSHPLDTFRVNVDGVLNLLECVREDAALSAHTSVLVVGSGEVYGVVPREQIPIREDAPLNPVNPYAVSKACADMITRQYRASFGLDVTVARPFNHLGPGQNELFVGSAFARQLAEIRAGRREPKLHVGNLEPKRDFTDVRDVVRAYVKILEIPRREPVYNVCSGRAMTIQTLLDHMIQMSGITVEVCYDVALSRKIENPESVGDASRLHAATGWQPLIPIEQTVREILAYWQSRIDNQA